MSITLNDIPLPDVGMIQLFPLGKELLHAGVPEQDLVAIHGFPVGPPRVVEPASYTEELEEGSTTLHGLLLEEFVDLNCSAKPHYSLS